MRQIPQSERLKGLCQDYDKEREREREREREKEKVTHFFFGLLTVYFLSRTPISCEYVCIQLVSL